MQRIGELSQGSARSERAHLPAVIDGAAPAAVSTKLRHRAVALSSVMARILQESQRELGFSGESSGAEVRVLDTAELDAVVRRVAERLGFELTNFERDEILSNLEREQKPFGLLQELVDDASVSDIIVTNYAKIDVQQGRRNFSTGLSFASPEAYESYVERLLQRAGTTYSTKKPIADGMIGPYARLHVVHKALCESGPYLTIRLNRFSRVACADLVASGMAPAQIFNYLKKAMHCGLTMLVVGEVGTGKTTLARALSSTAAADESILVIEDTPEIRLEHPHVRYVTTREANTDGAGRINPSECIRAGMRMAMNRIIFGEIRDAEAAEAFVDVCASGHPGLTTIHARSALEATARLELFLGRVQTGVGRDVLREQIVTAVQVICFVDFCKETGRRRLMEVREIGPIADGAMRSREIFRYDVQQGLAMWRVVNRVSAHRDLLEDGPDPCVLSQFPTSLDLGISASYGEASRSQAAVRGGL